ncbi:glycosyltransferase [Neorhizobium galegae]|uniref:glycosyltransferase n=1 Tax=Neorhizobium galegae TaxID=399 RepID=UPI00062192F2|nr:glycosyltransferase [Neorhizobium galegae]MCQ1766625.1 glycosyltransferase [Neorhizobium galegae]MCQ1845749.1 glycosyltransferase [Neorhizobium galegae]CDZ35992.1 Putative colanic acid biosynthesis glycosyltransferase WcaL [Neorhizobium galegae bv. officinalis]
MRIAYFTNQYPAPSHTFIRREIVALEARGHQVERYAVRPFRGALKDSDDIGEARRTSHILRTPMIRAMASVARQLLSRPGSSLKALGAAFRFARTSGGRYLHHLVYFLEAMILADWCRRDKIDHLHVHFGTNPATVAALAHQIGGIKFSFTVHGPEEFDRPETLGLGDKIRASSFVVAVSSYGRSQLLRWADLADWRKIEVVHCGIDQRYLSDEVDVHGTSQRLVCIARLSEQKGHLLLLQAAANLRAEGMRFQLVLVGDGPLRAEIGHEIERLGLADTVVLTGTISQDDVRSEILRAKALVLPSFAEGLPVVLMESMALKRPVISTYIAGIPELVQPDNGWLVPAGDLEALTGAMRQALFASDVELFHKGEAGRRRTLERHDINRSAAALEILMARPAV